MKRTCPSLGRRSKFLKGGQSGPSERDGAGDHRAPGRRREIEIKLDPVEGRCASKEKPEGRCRCKNIEKAFMTERFYITTPIYYVNAEPHIGYAYTTILRTSPTASTGSGL